MKTPGSEKSTPYDSGFDPAQIPRFSVLSCDYLFAGDPDPLIARRFVCIEHVSRDNSAFAYCLKATSKVAAYKNNPARMAGVVFYPAGTLEFFERDTVIEPDNQIPIPHLHLSWEQRRGKFRVLGLMPDSFPAALVAAVKASVTLTPRLQQRLLGCLPSE